jgi:molecular chaperone Hsp33
VNGPDRVVRAVETDDGMRIVVALASATAREICGLQDVRGLEAVVLARALTSATLLATLTKLEHERVRIHIGGGGPIGAVIVDAHGDGRVRACLERALADNDPRRTATIDGRATTAEIVGGRGHVVVTRDIGLRVPYQGTVEMASGEIDEDVEHYLVTSEQLPSALRVAVRLDGHGRPTTVAGVLCQCLPEGEPERVEAARIRLRDDGFEAMLLSPRTPEDLIAFVLAGAPARVSSECAIRFHCPCGPERARSVLSVLGVADLRALAGEQEMTEVRCHFCGRVTRLDRKAVRALADEL